MKVWHVTEREMTSFAFSMDDLYAFPLEYFVAFSTLNIGVVITCWLMIRCIAEVAKQYNKDRGEGFPKFKVPSLGTDPKLYPFPSFLSEEQFHSLRQVGDPQADEVLSHLWTKKKLCGRSDVLSVIEEEALSGDLICSKFLQHVNSVPPWMDPGNEVLHRFLTRTRNGSIWTKRIQAATGRLKDDVRQRLFETLFMLTQLYYHELKPGSPGHRALIQVRLLHASARRFVSRAVKWNEAEKGVPINQQDSLAALLLFSSVMIRVCKSVGVQFTAKEQDAVSHLWRCAGFYLGIIEEHLPKSFDEEQELGYAMAVRTLRGSPLGTQLTKRLFEAMHFSSFMTSMVRWSSTDVAEMAQLPPIPYNHEIAIRCISFTVWAMSKLKQSSPLLQWIIRRGSYAHLRNAVFIFYTKFPLKSYEFEFKRSACPFK